ncbi:MAG: TIGR02757 family protein [Bacteroidota bacterium]
MTQEQLKIHLDRQVDQYNRPSFIENDPISIPHQFSRLQDIEIMGFWTAMLAWGQRKTIINKANELIARMDGAPYDFILNHQEQDRKKLLDFKHRTFLSTDTLYFLEFLQTFYQENDSLEKAFLPENAESTPSVEKSLTLFHRRFFALEHAPKRTRKHVATPERKSTCKRLNMFLRWMVRKDNRGVDFGLWHCIQPSQLLMPLDVHVDRVARKLNLLKRKQTNWLAVLELSEALRKFDPDDPVKYDFALFGAGVLKEV